jgi:SAM-dependent methyltransferase
MKPTHIDRFEQFLAWYGDIHHLPEAYADASTMEAHYQSAVELFDASVPFLEALHLEPNSRVLDIGLGYGFHCKWFAGKQARVLGITTHMTDEITDRARQDGYEVACMDMHFLDLPNDSQDLLWSHHSLEHSFSPLFALREWLRVLKPGGTLAVTVPPHKTEIVSGHFTTGWTVGQLLYLLAVAGFEVADGLFLKEGYNVRARVTKPLTPNDPTSRSWIFRWVDELPEPLGREVIQKPQSMGRYAYPGAIRRLDQSAVVWDRPQTSPPGRRARIKRFVKNLLRLQ